VPTILTILTIIKSLTILTSHKSPNPKKNENQNKGRVGIRTTTANDWGRG
jgi:hypothetical protein